MSNLAGSFESFVALVRSNALLKGDQPAFIFLENGETETARLSFAELDLRARRIGALLQDRAVRGDRVLLLYQPGLDFVTGFFGCLYAGLVAVPAFPPRANKNMNRLNTIIKDAGAKLALTSSDSLTRLMKHGFGELGVTILTTDDQVDGENKYRPVSIAPHDLAFLQYTSGSTGEPRGVMVSHLNLIVNSEDLSRGAGTDENSIMVSWLPTFHDMGLIFGVLQPVYKGFTGYLMAPAAFLQRPFRWLRALSDYRGTHTAAPNFAFDLCVQHVKPEERDMLDLSHWRMAINGAEPVHWETLSRFSQTFASCGLAPTTLCPGYGLAEGTLKITCTRADQTYTSLSVSPAELEQGRVSFDPNGRTLVGCGGSEIDTRIAVVDTERHEPCESGRIGEIWIAGETIARGYWNRPRETGATFSAKLAEDSDRTYLRTGDLGFLHEGSLYVTGRIKDVIIIRGRNHYPQDIERTVESVHTGLRADCGAAFTVEAANSEALVVVHELDRHAARRLEGRDQRKLFEMIRQAITEQHDLRVHAIVLIRHGSVPKTSSGKIQRQAARRAFLSDDLKQIASWYAEEPTITDTETKQPTPFSATRVAFESIQQTLIDLLAGTLEIPAESIHVHQPFAGYGLDSAAAARLSADLTDALGDEISPTLFYDYPTVAAVAEHLTAKNRVVAPESSPDKRNENEPIAVVGIGCRFPGAEGPDLFWELLQNGGSGLSDEPPPRDTRGGHGGRGGYLKNVELFDAELFGVLPAEAARMDPQQRLLLETAYEALEHAGISADTLAGSKTGVFVGIASRDYERMQIAERAGWDNQAGTGNAASIAANRLSYFFDFHGPSVAVDTACSSALVAVHQAVRALRNGECEAALAGGVNLILDGTLTEGFAKARMLSPEGRCKTFDASADGYVRSEGCGVVLLRRLSDAERNGDTVLALIRGSAVNQDGRSNGLTAPNGPAQEAVIRAALHDAGVKPHEISYVEAHGSGTPLGDPIEFNAIKNVLSHNREADRKCGVGAVKTNIGHTEAAAGIAGLIKTVLAIHHGEIPRHLYFKKLNPQISPGESFFIPSRPTPWPNGVSRRVAGVSSFGFGGTNAHVVLQHYRGAQQSETVKGKRPLHLLTLSAKSEKALAGLVTRYADYMVTRPDVDTANLCHTAAVGRPHYRQRLAVMVADRSDVRKALAVFLNGGFADNLFTGFVKAERRKRLVFLFTGQGTQYPNMGRTLFNSEPVFRQTVEQCDALVRGYEGVSILPVLFPEQSDDQRIHETFYTQICLFTLEYAMACTLMSWGILPDAVIGHSIGELVAARVADAIGFEDAIRLVIKRGRLMNDLPRNGAMATVFADDMTVRGYLGGGDATIAAVNAPENTVISGPAAVIGEAVEAMTSAGIRCRKLKVSHAFHSSLMDPILNEFEAFAANLSFREPRIPLYSNLTGRVMEKAPDAVYWRKHLRGSVRFAEGLSNLERAGCEIYVEVGPRQVLTGLADETLQAGTLTLPTMKAGHDEWRVLLEAVARLYAAGVTIDWRAFDREQGCQRIQGLPSYPFDRKKFWYERGVDAPIPVPPPTLKTQSTPSLAVTTVDDKREQRLLGQLVDMVAPLLKVPVAEVSVKMPFLEMGADSLVLVDFIRRIQDITGVKITVRQMFEEIPTLEALAAYLHGSMPAEKVEHLPKQPLEQDFPVPSTIGPEPIGPPRRVRVQDKLVTMVAPLLKLPEPEVDVRQPFLEMGADSLVLVDFIRRIQDSFSVKIAIRQMFEEIPTLETLAAYIDREMPAEKIAPKPIPPAQPEQPQPAPSAVETIPAPAEGNAALLARMMDQHTQIMTMALQVLQGGGQMQMPALSQITPQSTKPVEQPASRDLEGVDQKTSGFWARSGTKPSLAGGGGKTPKPARELPKRERKSGVTFSLYYFGSYEADYRGDKYKLLIEAARFADRHDFEAIWFPERHFHAFGGFSPNPSVMAAAFARETKRIHLRAGSVVGPLHHPVRIAEEWAMVDNLSSGRVGVAFASGWHPDDFIFAPEAFGKHRDLMFQTIEDVRKLWRGETIPAKGGAGNMLDVKLFPMPSRTELPIWLTIVNNPETYALAGKIGAGVLTNLMGQTAEDLAGNIQIYREALAEHGHDPESGRVTVLLHTFVGKDLEWTRDKARQPFIDYLSASIGLLKNLIKSQGIQVDFDSLSDEDRQYLLSKAYDRYITENALIGTPESCAEVIKNLHGIGVDEIACFVDFGVDAASVVASLPVLDELRLRVTGGKTTELSVEAAPVKNTATSHGPYKPVTAEALNTAGLKPRQERFLQNLTQRFMAKTPKSKALTQRYRPVLADYRAALGFRFSVKEMFYPIEAEKTEGSRLWDIDGNVYLDITMGFGVTLFGHNPPFLAEALQEHARIGIQMGPRSKLAGRTAELFCELTGNERVAFCSSGTESVMAAIRLARRARGRSKIVIFENSYHGHSDTVLARRSFASGELEIVPISPGVPANAANDVLVLEYDSPESLETIREHADELAAVLVEPIQSRYPELQPVSFLKALRWLTEEHEIPLIFDEMITGFRSHPGGVQALFGIRADLVTYGKVLGGGMPIGAVAGKAKYMDGIDGGQWQYGDRSYPREETTFFAGTYQMHSLALATAHATLAHLKAVGPGLQEKLNRRTAELAETLNAFFRKEHAPIHVAWFSSLFVFKFQRQVNSELFYYQLMEKGIFIKDVRSCFLSTAHSEEDIAHLIDTVKETVWALQEGGILPKPPGGGTRGKRSDEEEAFPLPEALPARGSEFVLPLSETQRQVWLLSKVDEKAVPAYTESTAIRMRGNVRVDLLCQALTRIVSRHDALRSVIAEDGSHQIIKPEMPVALPVIEQVKDEADWHRSDISTPLDMNEGPLFRFSLLRRAENEYLLVLRVHHIIVDGLSFALILRELSLLYTAAVRGEDAHLSEPAQYWHFLKDQRAYRESESGVLDLEFWRGHLPNRLPVLDLPTDKRRPARFSFRGARHQIRIMGDDYTRLKRFAAGRGYTTFMMMMVGYAALLHRLTESDQVLLGFPVAGRFPESRQDLVGFCTHLLGLHSELDTDLSVENYLRAMKTYVLDAYEHQQYPLSSLARELDVPHDAGRGSFLSTVFNMDRMDEPLRLNGLDCAPEPVPTCFAKYDLALDILEAEDTLSLTFEYATDLFEEATIAGIARRLPLLLEGMIADPTARLAALPLIDQAERERLVGHWSGVERDYPREATIHQLFAERAAVTPDSIALVTDDRALSYGDLERRANQLAHYLIQKGAFEDAPIAICLPRSPEMVVAILAVLKAGAAYFPLEAGYPEERLAFMLGDAGAELLITDQATKLRVIGPRLIRLDGLDAEAITTMPETAPATGAGPNHLAYVMYTSGSTGQPKGVAVMHRNVVRLVRGNHFAVMDEAETFLQFAPNAFDAATLEIWGALLNGGRLVVFPPGAASLEELSGQIQRQRVTTVWLTAGLFHQMVHHHLNGLKGVRQLLAGGDVLAPEDVKRVLEQIPGCRVINGYGPTENTTFTTCHAMSDAGFEGSVPIGTPIANTRIYVVDKTLNPVAPGFAGELVTGGDGLSRGYLERPGMTAERFVPNPFSTIGGERLYRTGDLVRFLSDGTVAFLGRRDFQVKVRGFRIEPGEIRQVLAAHPRVDEAAVIVRKPKQGEARLFAYARVSAQLDKSALLQDLREHMRDALPAYMVPSSIVILDSFPLNDNGKVDVHALPEPSDAREREVVEPRNPVEAMLVTIWRRLLEEGTVGIHDDFFELGGHSLLATRAVSEIRRVFGVDLPLRDFFECPTPARLAAHIEAERRGTASESPAITTILRDGRPLPLSFAQQRLWFLDRLEPGQSQYSMTGLLRFQERLDVTALRQTLDALTARHESLRTRFPEQNGEPVQEILPHTTFPLETKDFSQEPEQAESWIADLARAPFDLTRGPLFRAVLIQLGVRSDGLLLHMHHIISDGWSLNVLGRELFALYNAAREGRAANLPTLPIQYADYAAWQRDWLRGDVLQNQLAYWKDQLGGERTILQLPTDHARPAVQRFDGASLSRVLSPGLTARLAELSRTEGVTLYMTLLSAFYVLLFRYSGQSDLCVGAPIANRNRGEIEGLIGFFVNTLVMRGDLSGKPSFRELLARVRTMSLAAYDHQDVPFEMLVDALEVRRDLSRNPLFQVLFDYHRETGALLGDGQVSVEEISQDAVICDLSLTVSESENGLQARAEYSTVLFEADTVNRLLAHYENLLEAVVVDPQRSVTRLPLLTETERRQQLFVWNDTRVETPSGSYAHKLFEARANHVPGGIAVRQDGRRVSYGALRDEARVIAAHLRRLGVGTETRVGVCMDRSPRVIAAVLGVLMAGGAYVPLDPAYPSERLTFMIEDSGLSVLLTESNLRDRVPDREVQTVVMDQDEFSGEYSEAVILPEQAAYMIYTSGSTGKPKGAVISQRALAGYTVDAGNQLELTSSDRILQFASLSFDVTVEEIFPTLANGAMLVLPADNQVLSHDAFLALIKQERVTGFELPTHYWSEWVEALEISGETPPDSLRYVIVGTERIAAERLNLWRRHGVRLIHVFGLTEVTVTSLMHRFDGSRTALSQDFNLPIGRPVGNTRIYLLDDELQPVPVGVSGELYVGGFNLGRGYHGRPDLTAARFIPDPFGPESAAGESGARLYCSGDLARQLPDGNVVFLGRRDLQVKIRGYRIELGEIEAALRKHQTVSEAVVTVRKDHFDQNLLAAWLVAEGEPKAAELATFLKQDLPDHMIPDSFTILDQMPVTPNGKIDLNALNKIMATVAEPAEPPVLRGDLAKRIAGIWCEVLHLEKVGPRDNFFEIGGNSMRIVRVFNRLTSETEGKLTITDLFQHPTVEALAALIDSRGKDKPRALTVRASAEETGDAIAVIGLACRFAGSPDAVRFWQNLVAGNEGIRLLSDEELRAAGLDSRVLADPDYVKAKGVLEDGDLFDAELFGFTPREAEVTDPQQRVFLEQAWRVLEDAGYDPARYDGRIGVFAGQSRNSYLIENLLPNRELLASVDETLVDIGNAADFLPTRVSYKLGLKGPSVNVQTACSTSLVAVVQAFQNLREGHCDMAVAGGVSIEFPQTVGYYFQEAGILSPDGHCRAFDEKAGGTVYGEGAGAVLLKRLADAQRDGDHIYAVVKGAAVNNDGALKVGFTAPGVEGQAEVIAEAQAIARVNPRQIQYVETHGTGTALGDPTEIAALQRVFSQAGDEMGYCAIGSVKTNIGHADAAAGIAGLIKTVLALHHQQLPASLHFEKPNPNIDFADSPFYVNGETRPWEPGETTRYAGVSSFGIGGTNAHVILAEAPPATSNDGRGCYLLPLSAASPEALEANGKALADYLANHPECNPADVAYTLQVGRAELEYRRTVVGSDLKTMIETLKSEAAPTRTVQRPFTLWMFSGQGSQYAGMAAHLYRAEPRFRQELDACCDILKPILGKDLRGLLFPTAEQAESARETLNTTAFTQPALFALEYAMAQTLCSWGMEPDAMIGHSIGEYVAACLAGVMTRDAALALVAARGRLIQALPGGAMLSVSLAPELLAPLLGEALSLAAINGPEQCVVSGPASAIEALAASLEAPHRRLHTSHAFHSRMMEPALEAFRAELTRVALKAPQRPYISNVTGDWVTGDQVRDPEYWVRHLRETVLFDQGLALLAEREDLIALEIGPGRVLANLARARIAAGKLFTSLPHPQEEQNDHAYFLRALGNLWRNGVPINWSAYHDGDQRRRLSLPGYVFQRRRYLIEAPVQGRAVSSAKTIGKDADVGNWFYLPSWKRSTAVASKPQNNDLTLLVLRDETPFALSLCEHWREQGVRVIEVLPNGVFDRSADDRFTIDPSDPEHFRNLAAVLLERELSPQRVIHLWSLPDVNGSSTAARFDAAQERGLFSLLYLIQAFDRLPGAAMPSLVMVTDRMQQVAGESRRSPEKATLLSFCRVLQQEFTHASCRSIDLVLPESGGARERSLVRQVASECLVDDTDRVIAFRDGHRWVENYEPVMAPHPETHSIKQGGVYLITGGLGKIGFALAAYLHQRYQARVILLGRTPLPDESIWRGLLNDGDKEAWRIKQVTALREMGADPLLLFADMADAEQVHSAVEDACERFGTIDGVFHAAGLTDDSHYHGITETTPEHCRLHFEAKVYGLLALERALAEVAPDFVMVFSSVAAVLGGLGYLAYAAANTFAGSRIVGREHEDGTRWLCLDWDGWLLAGHEDEDVSKVEGKGAGNLAFAMTAEEGFEVIERALALHGTPRLVISTGDLRARMSRWLDLNPLRDETGPKAFDAHHPRPELSTPFEEPRDEFEQQVADIWQDLLGIAPVGIHDNFFELGGDSLLAIKLSSRLWDAFTVKVSGVKLLETQTVADLTVAVLEEMIAQEDEDLDEILA